MEYYAATKGSEVLMNVTVGIKLEHILLNERNQMFTKSMVPIIKDKID